MEPGTAAKPAPAEAAPAFDVVRVEPDGSAAVVGTAEPGAKVTIYADEAPLAEAEADAEGNFVAIFKVEPSAEPRALDPRGGDAGGGRLELRGGGDAAAAGAGGAGGRAGPGSRRGGGAAGGFGDTRAGRRAGAGRARPGGAARGRGEAAAPEVAATVIVRKDSVEVAPADADGTRRVTLGAVSYAEGGEVTLAGAGTAGAVVRAYVDDRFAEEARVAADGRWSMRLGDVAEGIYRLRIDELAEDGKVASRVETPFQRDYPRPPPPRPGAAGGRGGSDRLGDGAAGAQPLDFGADALWFGCALHPDLHRQPRPNPRPGPDLSRADLQHARERGRVGGGGVRLA